MDDRGLEGVELSVVVVGIADDDDAVAGVHEAGGGSIEADVAGAAGDDVGLEPSAVVDVDDSDLLPLEEVRGLHQLGVDRDGADVIEVGVGDRRRIDLVLHHAAAHQTVTPRLSMRRAGPRRAAASRRSSPCSTSGTERSDAETTSA